MKRRSPAKTTSHSGAERQQAAALRLLLNYANDATDSVKGNRLGDFRPILAAALRSYGRHGGGKLKKIGLHAERFFATWLTVGLRKVGAGEEWSCGPVTPELAQADLLYLMDTSDPEDLKQLDDGFAPVQVCITADGPRYESETEFALRWRAVQILLHAQHRRIAECACGKLFVRIGRSLFCSSRCAGTARSARYHARLSHARKLDKARAAILSECPDNRTFEEHGHRGGVQHRVRPDGSISCAPWGVDADTLDRSRAEVLLERALAPKETAPAPRRFSFARESDRAARILDQIRREESRESPEKNK